MKIPRNPTGHVDHTPGPWWFAFRDALPGREKRLVPVMMGTCGHAFVLTGHVLAPDGTVSPSVVCPYHPCWFHEFVVLEGWAAS